MNKKRVVVTGLGVISSIGQGKEDFWNALIAGKSGISKVTSFDTTGLRCHYAGEIQDFNPENYFKAKDFPFLSRTSQLGIASAILAFKDAGININSINPETSGVIIGTTMGEKNLENTVSTWIKEGCDKIENGNILQSSPNNISTNIGSYFGIKGCNYLIPTACAAANYSLGYAFNLISSGQIETIIAGGVDSFSKIAFCGFHRLYAMAPEKCQPFDKNRKGMLVGEAGAILYLESLDSALKRNAKIYAEILGCGLSCDASHMTQPKAEGIEKAILKALKETGINKEDVSYISAHGTGTPANDKAECNAIRKVFSDNYENIPVSSIKSMLGHTMGAASGVEAITCCLSVQNDIIPPTINYETPDPDCGIDCVPNTARKHKVRVALNNGFAFGGNNACLVIKKFMS
ncbi:MAG: beta-ketoacyl-[acyl-carrier-protein] synthase family protein [Candidatus Omnitrophica bacterium]|nr:beta-ketoacyl-[acyl-carrier-protein] synthase family protein [Candidatus Omnitrophota bacterium]